MVAKWFLLYDLAKKYYDYYGDLNVPIGFKTSNGIDYDENGEFLGRWISNLRKAKIKDKLKPGQIKSLENIGMIWVLRTSWDDYYDLAKNYYEKYDNLEISYDFVTKNGVTYDKDGLALGAWINTQLHAYYGTNKCRMDEERISKLRKIGMNFELHGSEEKWQEKYQLAKRYYEKYGNLNISQNFITSDGINYDPCGIPLGLWIMNQRMAYKGKGTCFLNYERIKSLEEIGMRWFSSDKENSKKQEEIITKANRIQKQKEILSRIYSFLITLNCEELSSTKELSSQYLVFLNKNKK